MVRFKWRIVAFCILTFSCWLLMYGTWRALPFVQAGFEQIYSLKSRIISEGRVFPSGLPRRLVILGDSRVLSGFNPDQFDALSGGSIYSFNLGLPNASQFLAVLELLVANGEAPTHVLLTFPWSEKKDRVSLSALLRDDQAMLNRLFPFRHIARDIAKFAVRSVGQGGLGSYRDSVMGLVERAKKDRGYFFMAAMSHFPDDRLPDDFYIESERPDFVFSRAYSFEDPNFFRLLKIGKEHNIRFIIVPTYYREGLYAPAGSNRADRIALRKHGIELLGPDYWLYPNRSFSDPTHLNPNGAEAHTRRLWDLLQPVIGSEIRTGSAES